MSCYSECLTAIEDALEKAEKYSSVWLNYQSLWDMDMSVVQSRVGEDLNLWQKLLNDIKLVVLEIIMFYSVVRFNNYCSYICKRF